MTIRAKSGLALVFCILSACAGAPAINIYFVEPGVMQYYVPKTSWAIRGVKTAWADLDITFRNNREDPSLEGTVNLSFFNTQKNPQEIASACFKQGGAAYPLGKITVLYTKAKNKELRVTTKIRREDMLAVLRGEPITLAAVIDGAAYEFEPPKAFRTLKNELLAELTY